MDLLRAVIEDHAIDSPRVAALVSGMDGERSWRVALFLAAVAAGVTEGFADATGLPAAEIVQIFSDELTGTGHHEH